MQLCGVSGRNPVEQDRLPRALPEAARPCIAEGAVAWAAMGRIGKLGWFGYGIILWNLFLLISSEMRIMQIETEYSSIGPSGL